MKVSIFDPFKDRQARNIRNSLAGSFLKALTEKDVSVFKRYGRACLDKYPEAEYVGYVKTRIAKYEEAFAIIEQRGFRAILQQVEIFWDLELFYELHEHLELSWKNATGKRRKALQGLIRAAGMKVHSENKNWQAAHSMGSKAQADLLKYGGELTACAKLDAILAEIDQILGTARQTIRADEV